MFALPVAGYARSRRSPFQTAEFDGLGRRIKKVVTNAGDYEKTEVYFYDGQRIVQTNNGSGAVVQQFIHGTQYIDELVMMRVKDKGDVYVHQIRGDRGCGGAAFALGCSMGSYMWQRNSRGPQA